MSDIEKAIEVIKTEKKCVIYNTKGCDRKCEDCVLLLPDKEIISAYNITLSILREKQERDNPQPLTLEQLKERIGKPVWIKNKYGKIFCRVLAFYLDSLSPDSRRFIFTDGEPLFVGQHGTEWDAYDYEPKGATP